MIKSIKELLDNLKISETFSDVTQLEKVREWCSKNISSDREFMGDPAQQFKEYIDLARTYFDTFMAFKSDNLYQLVPQFQGMNTLQYASWCGYDVFLSNLGTTDEKLANTPTEYGMMPLHLAAMGGYVNTSLKLLQLGAEPTKANKTGQFPLITCLILPISNNDIMKRNKTALYRILASKAPFTVNAVDKNRSTVAHLMAIDGYDDLLLDILQTNPSLVNQADITSQYPLQQAIANGQLKAAIVLLTADGAKTMKDGKRKTPLHYAALQGDALMVAACCDAGLDFNAQDTELKTPLICAAQAENLDAVKELLNRGADPMKTDYAHRNVLHYAAKTKNKPLIELILEKAKDTLNKKDDSGHTPLDYANGVSEQLLIAKGAKKGASSTFIYK